MSKKVFLLFLVIIAVCGYIFLPLVFSSQQVMVTHPERGKAVEAVYATGTVEPVYWAMLSAPISGNVTELLKDEGEAVELNEVIARLDDRAPSAEIQKLRASASYLKSELVRQNALSRKDFSSQKEYQRIRSEYEALNASLQAANKVLSDTKIISPLNGQILRRMVEIGEYVKMGDAICWVGIPSPLQIIAEVDEEDIPKIYPQQAALIKADAFPETVITGGVTKIVPKGDPINKIFLVEISIPKETKLMIGMTTEVNFVAQEKEDALLIPSSAVLSDMVWIAQDGMAEKKEVKTGIVGDKRTEIVEGLSENDLVILQPPQGIQEGDRLQVVMAK